jgi:hypothetical protein
MLRTVFLILLALVIAIGGGAASVWMMLENAPPVGGLHAGPWTAFPDAGTPEADPYSRARFAREGGIPLGRSEGIVFVAARDSAGAALTRGCIYQVQGSLPAARFWTIHAADAGNRPLPPFARRAPVLHSEMVLRGEDNALAITVSAQPSPGNWLAVTGRGPMHLVLTLLDTPFSTGFQVARLVLPDIRRVSCDG